MIPVDLKIESLAQFPLFRSGWLTVDEAYEMSRYLFAGAYMICDSLYKPDDDMMPWEMELIDIGEGGGMELGQRMDAKNGERGKKTPTTNLFDRIKQGIMNLTSDKKSVTKKLKKNTPIWFLNRMYQGKRHRLWIQFVTLSILDIEQARDFKCEIMHIENDLLQKHKNVHKKVPYGNPKHSSKSVKVCSTSYTTKELQYPKLFR